MASTRPNNRITQADLESVAAMLDVTFVPLLEGEVTRKGCWVSRCKNRPVLLAQGPGAGVACCTDARCQITAAICAHNLSFDQIVQNRKEERQALSQAAKRAMGVDRNHPVIAHALRQGRMHERLNGR